MNGSCGPEAAAFTKGGERTFAASAKSKGQREESGRSGHQPVFSVVQTRRMAAVEPNAANAANAAHRKNVCNSDGII